MIDARWMSCADWRAHAAAEGLSRAERDAGARVFHAQKAREARALIDRFGVDAAASRVGVPPRVLAAYADAKCRLAPHGAVRAKIAREYARLDAHHVVDTH